jgi:hypothetical protein
MCPTLASTTYPEPRYPAILFAFVGDSTMTSGLPPAAALPRRAGTLVPPSVAAVLSLPVSLVFVGTVLLSVVLGTAEFLRVLVRPATATKNVPESAPGGPR